MADHSRIDDLRRRVQRDPASIAFAQLAEECRRAGACQEAVETCRAGLAIHPGYLSARVTLGRALIELGQLDEAQLELARVLQSAPENLAAIRGLAEIHHRRGDLVEALAQYRAALLLARNDPDLEETIADLSRQIEPAKPAPSGGLTLQHMQDELLKHAPPPPTPDRGVRLQPDHPAQSDNPAEAGSFVPEPDRGVRLQADAPAQADTPAREDNPANAGSDVSKPDRGLLVELDEWAIAGFHKAEAEATASPTAPGYDRAVRTVAALEQWLAAIHVSRQRRNA